MKRLTITLTLLIFATIAQAQFRRAIVPVTDGPGIAATVEAETLYAGKFTANLGFMAFSGWNTGELYQGAVNVRRGFPDESYINLFFTTPPANEVQTFGLAYGSLLSNPAEGLWLFLNVGVHYSTYPYVGLAGGVEAKYDFTEFVALSVRGDAVPAWNFAELGLGFGGQVAVSLTP